MSKKVSVFLADGFEEIEGLTVVDLLRRAEIEVTTVSISEELTVHGAHGIDVQADKLFRDVNYEEQDLFVLPGGMPGTLNLGAHLGLRKLLYNAYEQKQFLAAICAAPSVFGKYGFLEGRNATAYPGFEDELKGATYVKEDVVVSDFIITSRGMGTAIPFALALIEQLEGLDKANAIGQAIIYYR